MYPPQALLTLALPLLALAAVPAAAAPRFRDAGEAWGVRFRHHHGGSGRFYMVETMGSGVVVWDFDGDGDEDLFFVDSGPLPGYAGEAPRSVLFRNEGGGRFRDVTAASGLVVTGYGMGGTAGDADGDGDLDLLVTAFGASQLFENRGNGTFVDATARAGVGATGWWTSAGFADPDRDGDLDLYLANYVDFAFDKNPVCGLKERNLRSYCHPDVYEGLPDRFYRNRGDGTFEDVTVAAVAAPDKGNGLGVVWGDVDGDGWTDLYVANDMTPGFLFRNRKDGTFEEIGLPSGTALSDLGKPEAGMGVDLGDLDGNGHPDLFVTHLDLQTSVLYSNLGGGSFVDARYVSNLAAPSMHNVGFGAVFGDLDQDGDLDVAVANGHIIHNVELWGTGTTYKQRNQLFENDGKGRFREVPGSGLDAVRSSRGLAAGDLDGDGDLDLAVSNSDDWSELYENVGAAGGWLQVDLLGTRSNRSGIGTRVELEAAGARQLREARTASSYLSQNALTLHVGLGEAPKADRLTLRWPSGKAQRFESLPANRRVLIVE